ncbi:MAG: RNA methyltransferase [Lachnospiraceae bacterium]|nr:RNA methyltransferase [Lachnospiraceae bacterium]
MIEKITSATNPRIKRLTALRKKAKSRREEQAFIIEGERLYRDTPREFLKEIYMTEEFLEQKLGGAAQENITIITPQIMQKISDTDTPQGVLCVAKMPSYDREDLLGDEKKGNPLLLILENIQDPGNLGTMMRTAEAAGVTGVLMSRDTVDLFNPKTVRATMSAIFRVPFLYTDDLVGEIKRLQTENGIAVYAAHLRASKPYDEADCTGACAFLIGNEGNGLTDEAADAATARVHIPMQGNIESLNAAMAAGILLFEGARQRRKS